MGVSLRRDSVQPICTATLDFIFLGDAFYLMNLICGVGVLTGLTCVRMGKLKELEEISAAVRSVAARGAGGAQDEAAALVATSQRLLRRRTSVVAALAAEEESLLQPGAGDEESQRRGSADGAPPAGSAEVPDERDSTRLLGT